MSICKNLPPLFVVALILVASVSAPKQALWAQTNYGTLVGTVTDASGAIVSGARVTLKNNGTNATAIVTAGEGGSYTFPNLNPGVYTVTISSAGFKSVSTQNVNVQIGGSTRIDLVLQVGDATETVNVSTSTTDLHTDSASLDGVIEGKQISESPLNGRNVNNLLTFVPGVTPGGGTSGNTMANGGSGNAQAGGQTQAIAYGNYQIGGGFSGQSLFYYDGMGQNVPENNVNALVPTQDAVQEFRVSTNNISAEFGGFGGGVIQISSKSGTNQFHGNAYEYLRNTVLNANDWFSNNAALGKNPLKQNQYGANLSGPLAKNKAFFFFSWERESVVTASPVGYRVPTIAEMSGDFSSSFGAGVTGIYDPVTRAPYANNNIAGRINAAALRIVQLETPDQSKVNQTINRSNPFANNFTASAPIRGFQQQYNARVDYNIGKADQLFARYTYWDPHNEKSDPLGNLTGAGTTGNTTQEGVIGDTHIFNATTVADLRASYLKNYNFQNMLSLGYNMGNISPTYANIQSQSFGRAGTLPGLGISGYGIGAQTSQLYWDNTVWAVSGSLNKTLGRHSLKMGGNWRQALWTSFGNNGGLSLNALSSYTASPSGANGNALASFLLNAPSSTSISTIITQHSFLHSYALYLTDTFQATPKLTLTAGIRWEQPGAYSEVNDLNTVMLPTATASVGTITSITNPVSGGSVPLTGQAALVNSSAYPSRREEALHWNLVSPRVGFAYRVYTNSVVRAGYGISYLPAEITQDGPQLSQVGRAITTVSNTPGITSSATLTATVDNPLPNGVKQPLGRTQAAINAMLGYGLWARVPNQSYGYAQQWNVAVEHAFNASTSAMIAYAGAKGTHLVGSAAYTSSGRNLNQIPTQYAGRTDLLDKVANPFAGQFASDSPLYGATIPKGYLLLPHPQYPQGMLQQAPRFGASSYNALQATFTRRFNHGGIFQTAYTYAKLMSNVDNTSSFLDAQGGTAVLQDNYNTQAEWSRSAQDLTNNLVMNYGIDLPFGHDQMYGSHVSGLVNAVIGGWRINGITTLRSGTPIALVAQSNTLSSFGGGTAPFGLGAGIIRPNYTAGCVKMPSGPARTTARAQRWFNTACFTQPGDTSFGNESRVDADLKTMGTFNFDVSANKNFDITELVKLRFSGEIFNLFNRAQFAGPNATVGGGGFGAITHQANQPRTVQFALRAFF